MILDGALEIISEGAAVTLESLAATPTWLAVVAVLEAGAMLVTVALLLGQGGSE